MNIKPILARLQNVICSQEIINQMVLQPEPATLTIERDKSTKSINIVVGYNSSPNSQTALDITLLIAHQTRLATQKKVTVHVVYVLEENQSFSLLNIYNSFYASSSSLVCNLESSAAFRCTRSVVTQPTSETLATLPYLKSVDSFEQADRILWQARCLAEEWKGTFVAHLRFGNLATQLRSVVESETADLLLLGCSSTAHPVVQQLGTDLPCPLIGIPTLGARS